MSWLHWKREGIGSKEGSVREVVDQQRSEGEAERGKVYEKLTLLCGKGCKIRSPNRNSTYTQLVLTVCC